MRQASAGSHFLPAARMLIYPVTVSCTAAVLTPIWLSISQVASPCGLKKHAASAMPADALRAAISEATIAALMAASTVMPSQARKKPLLFVSNTILSRQCSATPFGEMKPSIPLLILNRNEFLTTDMLACHLKVEKERMFYCSISEEECLRIQPVSSSRGVRKENHVAEHI